jgi:enoyl-CoA hydratase/carnithine racemase
MKYNYGDHVSVALDGRHVALVEIDSPPNNYMSAALMHDLSDALEALDGENDCRAIVLTTAGKVFCAGADLANTGGMETIRALYDQAIRMFSVEKPVVAAVQGPAVGAGLGLALAADFRVAAPQARFSANFVKLGFHPGFAMTHTLPRLIGHQRAALMFLTGRRIKPDQALEWGLVDEVAPENGARVAALSLAREIAENAPLGVIATRKTLRAEMAAAARAQCAVEFEQQSILRVTEDYAEGIRAVNERRPGNFAGR